MLIFRTVIHGHVLECRRGSFGFEEVLIDGRVVTKRLFWLIWSNTHHFDIVDESGKTRHVEVAIRNVAIIGLRSRRAFVLVDGVERARVEQVDLRKPLGSCGNCGYHIGDLPAENEEICCPECGRHTPAKLFARI